MFAMFVLYVSLCMHVMCVRMLRTYIMLCISVCYVCMCVCNDVYVYVRTLFYLSVYCMCARYVCVYVTYVRYANYVCVVCIYVRHVVIFVCVSYVCMLCMYGLYVVYGWYVCVCM